MEKVGLCVTAADQLVLQPGVEVDQVPGVLPGVVHHLRGERPGEGLNIYKIMFPVTIMLPYSPICQLVLFVHVEVTVGGQEIGQGDTRQSQQFTRLVRVKHVTKVEGEVTL